MGGPQPLLWGPLPFPPPALLLPAGREHGVHSAHSPLSPLLAFCSHTAHLSPVVPAWSEFSSRMQLPTPPMCGVSHFSQFIPIAGPPSRTLLRTHDTYPPGLMCSLPRMPLPWHTRWCPLGVLALAPRSPLLGVSRGPDVPCACAGGREAGKLSLNL